MLHVDPLLRSKVQLLPFNRLWLFVQQPDNHSRTPLRRTSRELPTLLGTAFPSESFPKQMTESFTTPMGNSFFLVIESFPPDLGRLVFVIKVSFTTCFTSPILSSLFSLTPVDLKPLHDGSLTCCPFGKRIHHASNCFLAPRFFSWRLFVKVGSCILPSLNHPVS